METYAPIAKPKNSKIKKSISKTAKTISHLKNEVDDKSRKIGFTTNLDIFVNQSTNAEIKLKTIADKYDGYISSSNKFQTTLKVKRANFETAINEIAQLGVLNKKNTWTNDYTNQLHNVNVNFANAKITKTRYLELLAKAKKIEDALKVEIELERLTKEFDNLKSKLKSINTTIEYSSITIQMRQKAKRGIIASYSSKILSILF